MFDPIGWLIAQFQLGRTKRAQDVRPCCVCGIHGPTCCLPLLAGKRFCRRCAARIMS
jgi:hypothetical protein